jgi:hypothetical protein
MLKAGWLNRYLPEIARAVAPDVAVIIGFVWAGLMFVSAAINAFIALTCSVSTWAMIMPVYGIVSKVAVFLAGFLAMRLAVMRRIRAMPADQREVLLSAMGRHSEAPSLARSA